MYVTKFTRVSQALNRCSQKRILVPFFYLMVYIAITRCNAAKDERHPTVGGSQEVGVVVDGDQCNRSHGRII